MGRRRAGAVLILAMVAGCVTFSAAQSPPQPPRVEIRTVAPSAPAAVSPTPMPPAVSLDPFREGGLGSLGSPPGSTVRFQTEGHGMLRSGWALAVDPSEAVTFDLEVEGRADPGGWPAAAPSGAALERVETVNWDLPGGALSLSPMGGYRVTAPTKPGNYRFRMTVVRQVRRGGHAAGGARAVSAELVLLVRTPFDRSGNGVISGYPIGIYPNERGANVSGFVERHRELYAPPASFILATPEVEGLQVSEHYRLGDFVPPNDRGKTSYLALSPRLLEFLEAATAELGPTLGRSENGGPLVVLSAFLSPNQLRQYEAGGVKLTQFTRYQYGDGAAVIWDADGDGRLDDLNRDGNIDIEDARALAEALGGVQKKLGRFGGIGAEAGPRLPYFPETPYVDVDLRGVASRW